jgi:toxin FitB
MPAARRIILADWLNDQLLVRFAGRIVAVDVGVMLKWGQLTGSLERTGKTMSAMDSLIAATALHGNFNLVTRNEIDFQFAGVSLTNPWK